MENRYSLEEESSGNNMLESFLGDTISIITVEEMSGVNTEAETGALELVALGDTGNGLISLNDSAIVILSDGSQALITRQDSNISNCGLVEISDYQPEGVEVEIKDKELNVDVRDDEEMELKLEVDDEGEIQHTEEENINEPKFIVLEDGTVAYLKPHKQQDSNISNCGLVEISDYQPESDEMEIKIGELNEEVRDDEEVELKLEVDEEGEIQPTEEGNSNGAKFIALEDGTVAYLQPHQQQGLSEGVQSDDGSVLYFSLGLKKVSQPLKKEKSIPCSHANCGRIYTTLHHLKVHERSHTGSRPYSCPHEGCNKAFATDYSRKAHIRTHTGEKPYKCPTTACHKSFKTSGDLQKHIRTHTGERPFQCPILGCERSFTTSNICKVHVRSHTGERPYSCNVCGRSFASATNYKNHLRIHSGEKPYVCSHENCGRRFTEYSSLYKHSLVHSEEKPYHCCVCGRNYRQASTLAVHKRAAHNIIRADDGTEILLDHMITFKVEPQVETFSDSKQHDIQEDISSNFSLDVENHVTNTEEDQDDGQLLIVANAEEFNAFRLTQITL